VKTFGVLITFIGYTIAGYGVVLLRGWNGLSAFVSDL
jgi:hypothetical protein